MKKSNFIAMILGTVSGVFFALGMVMVLVPEFEVFNEGIILGAIGIISAMITVFIWRKMEKKPPIKFKSKDIVCILIGIIGSLGLGVGMSMTMVWNIMIPGIIVGLLGIICLISLVPIIKGIK